MKKTLLFSAPLTKALLAFCTFVLLGSASAWAKSIKFSAVAPSGQTLFYKITDSAAHTVSVVAPSRANGWREQAIPTGALIIPKKVSYQGTDYTVTAIGKDVFSRCEGLVSVEIPKTVRTIERGAFFNCLGLVRVSIAKGVATIGETAFCGTSLDEISVPNSVTAIGRDAFSNIRNVKYHGKAAGAPWGALTVNGYEEGDLYFSDKSKTRLTGCKVSATEVEIPSTVTVIGHRAFFFCRNLSRVAIPSSVTTIEDRAFSICVGLERLDVPASVANIEEGAFGDIRNVRYQGTAAGAPWGAMAVNGFEEGDLYYTDASKTHLVGCKISATNVVVPNTVTTIAEFAFLGCRSLKSVTLPNSLTFIGEQAFGSCDNLESINIPSSVTTIEDLAFFACTSLKKLVVPSSVETIGKSAFEGVPNVQYEKR